MITSGEGIAEALTAIVSVLGTLGAQHLRTRGKTEPAPAIELQPSAEQVAELTVAAHRLESEVHGFVEIVELLARAAIANDAKADDEPGPNPAPPRAQL